MKKEKLEMLEVIFSKWGYKIAGDKILNKHNKELGKSKEKGKKRAIVFTHNKKRYAYTYNEIMAWYRGVFNNIKDPDKILIDNAFKVINQQERLKKYAKKKRMIHELKMDMAINAYFAGKMSATQAAKRYKVDSTRLCEEIREVSKILGIRYPIGYRR